MYRTLGADGACGGDTLDRGDAAAECGCDHGTDQGEYADALGIPCGEWGG